MSRALYLALAYLCLGLGFIGIFVPGLPTTPFVLVAAWAAARGSARLHRWLHDHPLFGPMVRDWQAYGAVSRRSKWVSTLTMLACSAIFFLTSPRWWMAALGTAIMACVSVWLWLRPEPPASAGTG
ncbi:MAG: YbaN family protein [Rhodanobacteraceae bacterium]|nr:YbaN family protein [Rhodanobacteraceae bacterium]